MRLRQQHLLEKYPNQFVRLEDSHGLDYYRRLSIKADGEDLVLDLVGDCNGFVSQAQIRLNTRLAADLRLVLNHWLQRHDALALTTNKRNIMLNALGVHIAGEQPCRNYFASVPGTTTHDDVVTLVELGLMEGFHRMPLSGTGYFYSRVTARGIALLGFEVKP